MQQASAAPRRLLCWRGVQCRRQQSCCCTERSMPYGRTLHGSCCAAVGPVEPGAVAPEAAVGQQLRGRCARGACSTRGPRLGCLKSALAPRLHLSWTGTAGRGGLPVRSVKQTVMRGDLRCAVSLCLQPEHHVLQGMASREGCEVSSIPKRTTRLPYVCAKQGQRKERKLREWAVLSHVIQRALA